jgi:hypothetical protein
MDTETFFFTLEGSTEVYSAEEAVPNIETWDSSDSRTRDLREGATRIVGWLGV